MRISTFETEVIDKWKDDDILQAKTALTSSNGDSAWSNKPSIDPHTLNINDIRMSTWRIKDRSKTDTKSIVFSVVKAGLISEMKRAHSNSKLTAIR